MRSFNFLIDKSISHLRFLKTNFLMVSLAYWMVKNTTDVTSESIKTQVTAPHLLLNGYSKLAVGIFFKSRTPLMTSP